MRFEEQQRIQDLVLMEVVRERHRQIMGEGHFYDDDDKYVHDELVRAAISYAGFASPEPPPSWPWDRRWWKPTTRRRDLVKAAALILAEIERIDRRSGDHGSKTA